MPFFEASRKNVFMPFFEAIRNLDFTFKLTKYIWPIFLFTGVATDLGYDLVYTNAEKSEKVKLPGDVSRTPQFSHFNYDMSHRMESNNK